jgi:hypothetical protein
MTATFAIRVTFSAWTVAIQAIVTLTPAGSVTSFAAFARVTPAVAIICTGTFVELDVAVNAKMAVTKTCGPIVVAAVAVSTIDTVMTLTKAELFRERRGMLANGFNKCILAMPEIDSG